MRRRHAGRYAARAAPATDRRAPSRRGLALGVSATITTTRPERAHGLFGALAHRSQRLDHAGIDTIEKNTLRR